MIRFRAFRALGALSLLALGLGAAQGCTSSPGRTGGGTAGSSSAGSSGSAGAASGSAGSGTAGAGEGSAGASGGNPGSAGATPGTAGATGSAGADASAGGSAGATVTDAATDHTSPPFDAAGRTPPTCKTPVPSPIPAMKPTSECDFLLQSLDFEDMYNYNSPQIEITNFGTALGAYEINKCMPYCYAKELTIGVDIVGGGDPTGLQGEVIVHFPATGPELPITTAVGRDSLAWIQLSGDTAPPFKIMAQLVVESSTAGIIPAKNMVQVGYNAWLNYQNAEVKYFGIGAAPGGPFATDPVNIVGMGFRIFAPANLPKGMEWHGLLIIDHMEIRKGGEDMPAGTYPYGLN
jgi:hypothetical protein